MKIIRRESGVTEVVGFAFVMIITILAVTAWLLIALPIIGTNDEIQHNNDVVLQFADLKKDIEGLCISESVGAKREKIITLSPSADKSKISVLPDFRTFRSYGGLSIEYDGRVDDYPYDNYQVLNITYRSWNMYSDDISVTYSGGNLSSNGVSLLNGTTEIVNGKSKRYLIVVDTDKVDEDTIGSNEPVTIVYSLQDIRRIANSDNVTYVFNVGFK